MISFIKRNISVFIFFELTKISRGDFIFISSDSDKSFFYKGQWYSQLLDTIYEKLEKRYKIITISHPISKLNTKQTFGKYLRINGMIRRAEIFNRFYSVLFPYKNINFLILTWERIIKKVEPRSIVAISPTPECCIAANNLGIKVFDMQHGVISDDGYYGKEYRKNFGGRGWPNYILCWNSQSSQYLNDNYKNLFKTFIIGNVWIQRFLNCHESDNLVIDSFKKQLPIVNGKRIILITLQWDSSNSNSNYLLGLDERLVCFINSDDNKYIWWIRIHPVQLSKYGFHKINQLLFNLFNKKENVYWKEPTIFPLPIVLLNIDLHITYYSAVTYEASDFGIKTILLFHNLNILQKYFGNQILDRTAFVVDLEKESIEDCIYKIINSESKKINHTSTLNTIDVIKIIENIESI